MNKKDIKTLIWGAIGGIAAACITFSNSYFSITLLMIVVILSLFIADLASGGWILLACNGIVILVSAFTGGILAEIVILLLCVLPASILAWSMKRLSGFTFSLMYGSVAFSLGILIIDRLLVSASSGVGLYQIHSKMIDDMTPELIETAKSLSVGYSEDSIDSLIQALSSSAPLMKAMLPAFVVLFSAFVLFMVLMLSRNFIGNIPVPRFSALHVPKQLSLFYCILYIAGFFMGTSTPAMILGNVLLVLSGIITVCGLSLLWHLLGQVPSKALSVTIFIFALPVCMMMFFLVTSAGVIDGIFNFRRLNNETK